MAGSVALIWVCCGPSWADPAVLGSGRPRGHGRTLRSDALPWGRRGLSPVEAQIVREGNDAIIQGGMLHECRRCCPRHSVCSGGVFSHYCVAI
eukprot:3957357-Pyramimonas_sp.AAC.1